MQITKKIIPTTMTPTIVPESWPDLLALVSRTVGTYGKNSISLKPALA